MQRRYRNFKKMQMHEVVLRMTALLDERSDFQRFDAINEAVGKVKIVDSIRKIHKTVWQRVCVGTCEAFPHADTLLVRRYGSCTQTQITWRSSLTMLTPSAVTQAPTRTVICSWRWKALVPNVDSSRRRHPSCRG